MDGKDAKKSLPVNHRRNRLTEISNLGHGDVVRLYWDEERREWALFVDTANGPQIRHTKVAAPGPACSPSAHDETSP